MLLYIDKELERHISHHSKFYIHATQMIVIVVVNCWCIAREHTTVAFIR